MSLIWIVSKKSNVSNEPSLLRSFEGARATRNLSYGIYKLQLGFEGAKVIIRTLDFDVYF